MKKPYIEADLKILKLEGADIITTSNGTIDNNDNWDSNGWT